MRSEDGIVNPDPTVSSSPSRGLIELSDAAAPESRRKKFVVVGGGWAGWGASKALCESKIDVEVILLDALPDPTGVSFFRQDGTDLRAREFHFDLIILSVLYIKGHTLPLQNW